MAMAKFTVDGPGRLLIAKAGVIDVDVQIDLYSDAKEHWLTTSDSKWLFPFRVVAGDSIGGGQIVEPVYFLTNGWKIRPDEADHTLTFTGNLELDSGETGDILVPTIGGFTVLGRAVLTGNGRLIQASQVSDMAPTVFTVAAGSTTTEIRTDATQGDNFYNGQLIEVENSVGKAVRVVEEYQQTNGAFLVGEPLPFTPDALDRLLLHKAYRAHAGRAA